MKIEKANRAISIFEEMNTLHDIACTIKCCDPLLELNLKWFDRYVTEERYKKTVTDKYKRKLLKIIEDDIELLREELENL